MNETQTLVEWLADMQYHALPQEVQSTAKLCVLDTIGVGIFGARTEWSSIVSAVAQAAGGNEEASVWGHPISVSASQAALINGTSAHGLEMDDRKPAFRAHSGSLVVPAALACAEMARADGKVLLTAIVAGYEAAFRVGRAVPGQYERGMFTPAHAGIWGSTAAACKSLALDRKQMLDAFGIAGSMASGTREYQNDSGRDMVKRAFSGWTAHNGVMAALLAQRGMTGPRTVLEGEFGYCRVFGGSAGPNLEQLTQSFGKPYQIVFREVKPYAAWGGSHVCIEAIQQFKAHYPVPAESIESIVIGGCTFLIQHHEDRIPRSLTAAQRSLPFITALSFFVDLTDPNVWKSELLQDESIRRLAAKVRWHVEDEFEARHRETHGYGGARLTVRLRDGREFQTVIYSAKGTEENPMTWQEIHDKFDLLARYMLPNERVREIADAVDALDCMPDMRTFGRLLKADLC